MKYFILAFSFLIAGATFSQSKKKQIESLENRVDSLGKVNLTLELRSDLDAEFIKMMHGNQSELLEEVTVLQKEYEELLKELARSEKRADSLEKVISQLNKPKKEEKAKPSTTNTTSTNSMNNPFGNSGFGSGGGFGQDSGHGNGFSKGRVRLNNVDVRTISIEEDAKIYYKLTVDSDGNVVAFRHYKSKTTTTDQNLINKIGYAIKKQVKFNKAPGAPLIYHDYTIAIKAY